MAQTTGIEWCDATFNPWWGCEKVSPACVHCYADTLSRRYATGVQLWGTGHDFRFFGDKHWQEPLKWARLLPAKLGRRPRVFCASMADVFEERPELEGHRARLISLIQDTPELDWLILTKRPEFARDWLTKVELNAVRDGDGVRWTPWGDAPLPNVWMGVSIENARHTWRADVLREIPAAVRFISAEPLLGSLVNAGVQRLGRRETFDAANPRWCDRCAQGVMDGENIHVLGTCRCECHANRPIDLTGIDWVIAGGESGPKARPSHPDWFRELRDAGMCGACGGDGRGGDYLGGICDSCSDDDFARPAFFFKQWGEWAPGAFPMIVNGRRVGSNAPHVAVAPSKDAEWSTVMVRTGKKANGRLLDGREWDEFPASVAVPA